MTATTLTPGTGSGGAGSRTTRPPMPRFMAGLIGIVGLLLAWQVLGTFFGAHGTIPPPSAIVSQMRHDGFHLYATNAATTLHEAAMGWLWGNALAIGLALLFLLAPILEGPLMRLGIASYCIPIIAIGPILQITFNGQTPKIILAAMSVFFTTLVGTLVGLRSADTTSLDVIRAYGGGRVRQLTKVRLRAALPSLFAALRIAAPAAILGAIIGEYLGAETGLGVAMINSQQALEVERTWALAIVATLLAGTAFGLTALIGRKLTPWAPKMRG
jgi:ABC-type nitrate/sulfonate/bicarbonate transport system permease component